VFGFPRRPGPRFSQAQRLIGAIDGTNRTFRLPQRAVPGSVLAFTQSAALARSAAPLAETLLQSVVAGRIPTVNIDPNGGYYGSVGPACLIDGLTVGGNPYWSSRYTVPEVTWNFPQATTVSRAYLSQSFYGGFGGCATYKLEWSNDGSTWTLAATGLGAGGYNDVPAATASWWRIVGLTRGTYEWAMNEITLFAKNLAIIEVVLNTAPATGSIVYASYRVYQGN
jgi:hypothetical protein